MNALKRNHDNYINNLHTSFVESDLSNIYSDLTTLLDEIVELTNVYSSVSSNNAVNISSILVYSLTKTVLKSSPNIFKNNNINIYDFLSKISSKDDIFLMNTLTDIESIYSDNTYIMSYIGIAKEMLYNIKT